MTPAVSVVIPAYNAALHLPAALESVRSQDCNSLEVVVVDDGSTDETWSLLAGHASTIRSFRQRNSGVAAARNRAIVESRARLVAFLDADDIWLPGKLSKQLAVLADRADCGVCHSAFQVVSPEGSKREVVRYRRAGSLLHDLLMFGNVVGTPSTVVADRGLVLKLGGFDPNLSQCADWDLWLRLARITNFCYIDEPLVQYHRHEKNMSRNVALLERDSVRAVEKAFVGTDLPASLLCQRARALARNYSVLAGSYLQGGQTSEALRCLFQAIRLRPQEILRAGALPWRRGRRALARRASMPSRSARRDPDRGP